MKLAEMSKDELLKLQGELKSQYESFKQKELKLNMARGKPSAAQLDLSMGILDCLNGEYKSADGTDVRNYGVVDGLGEAKQLFADILGVLKDNVIVGGNASLSLMYDSIAKALLKGVLPGETPWCKQGAIKFLCPAPGYDRHFAICEHFDIEMIPVPMNADGPDMDMIEKLVSEDAGIKGIWCVPMYANPLGITYSNEVVKRFANLNPKASDFRIFWDNAYCVHHLDPNDTDELLNIYDQCVAAGKEDMVYMFTSTSKVTFAGGGISAMAASPANIEWIKKQIGIQTIGHDKVNQLRHSKFFGNIDGVNAHMAKHAVIMKPKFEAVLSILEQELGELDCATWSNPKGGYFVSLDTKEGLATRVGELCKEAGVVLTPVGATFPYKKDPKNTNIRIAPSFPPVDELKDAMAVLCVAIKLATVESLLA